MYSLRTHNVSIYFLNKKVNALLLVQQITYVIYCSSVSHFPVTVADIFSVFAINLTIDFSVNGLSYD